MAKAPKKSKPKTQQHGGNRPGAGRPPGTKKPPAELRIGRVGIRPTVKATLADLALFFQETEADTLERLILEMHSRIKEANVKL